MWCLINCFLKICFATAGLLLLLLLVNPWVCVLRASLGHWLRDHLPWLSRFSSLEASSTDSGSKAWILSSDSFYLFGSFSVWRLWAFRILVGEGGSGISVELVRLFISSIYLVVNKLFMGETRLLLVITSAILFLLVLLESIALTMEAALRAGVGYLLSAFIFFASSFISFLASF